MRLCSVISPAVACLPFCDCLKAQAVEGAPLRCGPWGALGSGAGGEQEGPDRALGLILLKPSAFELQGRKARPLSIKTPI